MRKNGYYWAYASSPKNFKIEGWIIIYYNNGSCHYDGDCFSEDCFKEIDLEIIIRKSGKQNLEIKPLNIADVKQRAMSILAEYGTQTTVEELEEYIEDPNAVLNLTYCLEAVEAALSKPFV